MSASPGIQPDLPRRARHSRDKEITATMVTMLVIVVSRARESPGQDGCRQAWDDVSGEVLDAEEVSVTRNKHGGVR